MRLGVLDVGSNTVHLLVVDAHRGGQPTAQLSEKSPLQLYSHLDEAGAITDRGHALLLAAVETAAKSAANLGCEELVAFATSAVREASNSSQVLESVRSTTGVDLQVLSGQDESRLTFLAARRWYGWSAGNMAMLDIGGGSLELAAGRDEEPDVALSLPLGAGRVHRDRLPADPPDAQQVTNLKRYLREELSSAAAELRRFGPFGRVVATSKTFRTLARLTGAAPSAEGPFVKRVLTAAGLRQVAAFLQRMAAADIGCLEGVSPLRANQMAAGALVAEAAVTALGFEELEICPWALREGIILRRLDQLAFTA